MRTRDPFIRKLVEKIEKVDRASVQDYLEKLDDRSSLFTEVLHKCAEGVIIFNPVGDVEWINESASTLLSVPLIEGKPKKLDEIIHDESLARFIREKLPKLSRKQVEDINLLLPQELKVRAYLSPLEAQTGKVALFLLDHRMSSKYARWDERFANIESLIKLSAGIAHEIGNPLNSISIHLQLLSSEIKKIETQNKAQLEKTVQVLRDETTRLDEIVRNFLKATRKQPLRFKQDDLNEALNAAIHFLKPELEASNVQVRTHLDELIPHFLFDRQRLYASFLNLIKNALEAMPEGGELEIATNYKKSVVSITFKDSGVGINEENLPHIFDTYFTTKKEGSGLGLMTVFNAIREHGGRIEVDSELGQGTLFTLYLPVRNPKLQLSADQE